jgi:RNA polymerase sigma-70 factor (ECF subfamily)
MGAIRCNYFGLAASLIKRPTLVLSEEQLIPEIRRGSKKAFAVLYERFRPQLLAYCRRILNNTEDAEDVVQDVFVKARSRIDSLNDGLLFRHWIFRIARNEALMKIRKQHPEDSVDEEVLWDEQTQLEQLEHQETSEIVQRLLKDLKHEYREVLVLREYDGLSYADIARIVGVSEDVIRVRIYRARSAMTEKLKKFYR